MSRTRRGMKRRAQSRDSSGLGPGSAAHHGRAALRPGRETYPNLHSVVSTTRSMNARTLAESRREVG